MTYIFYKIATISNKNKRVYKKKNSKNYIVNLMER